jgi:hypothetical protein
MNMPLTSTFLSGQGLIAGSTTAVKSKSSPRLCRQRISAAIQEPPVSKKDLRKPRTENVGADKGFYVDHTCIGEQAVAICISRLERGLASRLCLADAMMCHQLLVHLMSSCPGITCLRHLSGSSAVPCRL